MLGKIGSGFKWLGKHIYRLLRRNETLLIARFIPLPFLGDVVSIVGLIDNKPIHGIDKFEEVWAIVQALLVKHGMTDMDEARVTFIIELAVQIMKGNISAIDVKYLRHGEANGV